MAENVWVLGVERRTDRISKRDGLLQSIDITHLCSERPFDSRVRIEYLEAPAGLKVIVTETYPGSEGGASTYFNLHLVRSPKSNDRKRFVDKMTKLGVFVPLALLVLELYVPIGYELSEVAA